MQPSTDASPGLATLTRADLDAPPADDVDALRRFATVVRHPVGDVLFRRGQRADAMYIVCAGAVELAAPTVAGDVVVQVIRPGATVGDLSVMLDVPHAYTATARKATTVLRVDLETVRALVRIDADICYRFLRLVSRRLECAERRIAQLLGPSAFERVVKLLIDVADERSSSTVEMHQADMAPALGLSRQTVSRMLAELAATGLIERGHGRVRILDRPRLQSLHEPHPAATRTTADGRGDHVSSRAPAIPVPAPSRLTAWRRGLDFHRRPVQTLLEAEHDGGAAFALTAPVAGAMWVVATPDLAREVLHGAAPVHDARRCRAARTAGPDEPAGYGAAMPRRLRAGHRPGPPGTDAKPGDAPPDAIDVLRAEVGTDDAQPTDELFALLLAGHETTATALAWALGPVPRPPTGPEHLAAVRRRRPALPRSVAGDARAARGPRVHRQAGRAPSSRRAPARRPAPRHGARPRPPGANQPAAAVTPNGQREDATAAVRSERRSPHVDPTSPPDRSSAAAGPREPGSRSPTDAQCHPRA
jgi:CRP/FNR family cyclic AMP-dependent transcriptional regulator